MGTIYKDYTEQPLKQLGLEYLHAKKLTHKLNDHSIQQATKLMNTRCALQKQSNADSNSRIRMQAKACNPPDPH